MRRTWEKRRRRRRRMERVRKRMMKKMTLMGQSGRGQLRMMMTKRMKLKPRNRRPISRACNARSVWRTTPSRDSQFSSKPSTPQSSLLNKNTFKKRICLYFYLHFIFL